MPLDAQWRALELPAPFASKEKALAIFERIDVVAKCREGRNRRCWNRHLGARMTRLGYGCFPGTGATSRSEGVSPASEGPSGASGRGCCMS